MYLIFVVVTALIVLTIIIVKEVKKRDRRDLVIAYLPRSYGKYLSIFVGYFLFAYFNVNYFVKNMKELYTKLSPKYVDSIYKLLDPEILDSTPRVPNPPGTTIPSTSFNSFRTCSG